MTYLTDAKYCMKASATTAARVGLSPLALGQFYLADDVEFCRAVSQDKPDYVSAYPENGELLLVANYYAHSGDDGYITFYAYAS